MAGNIDKVEHSRSRLNENQTKRTERAEARAKRQAARRAEREAKLQNSTTETAPVTSPAATTTAAATSQTTQSTSEQPSATTSKNFIGDLKGAKVVNFAVQGGRTENSLSVFASGEGPNAVKPKTEENTATTDSKTVNTVA